MKQEYVKKTSAEIFKQSKGAGSRVGIGVVVPARQATQPGGIGFLESILGLLISLKIRAQFFASLVGIAPVSVSTPAS